MSLFLVEPANEYSEVFGSHSSHHRWTIPWSVTKWKVSPYSGNITYSHQVISASLIMLPLGDVKLSPGNHVPGGVAIITFNGT